MNHASNDYVDALVRRLESLQDEIVLKKTEVRELLERIKEREEQIDYILKLLAAEGVSPNGGSFDSTLQMSVSDMAYEVLSRQGRPTPMHYRELADLILAEGKLIPGQDPAANLIAHLTRDERFVRTGRGIYALAEWGIEPQPSSRRTKRKRR